ncbi:hypothetical protein D1007_37380 [Hordeum vulgare]|nr:hypothetical protein D1007_37380 [Hordeum vulgare]
MPRGRADGVSTDAPRIGGREGTARRACVPWWRSVSERSDVSRPSGAGEPAKGLRLGLHQRAWMRAEGRSASVARKALPRSRSGAVRTWPRAAIGGRYCRAPGPA